MITFANLEFFMLRRSAMNRGLGGWVSSCIIGSVVLLSWGRLPVCAR